MSDKDKNQKEVGAAMVIGGGIGGMQAALDLADSGIKVYMVEKTPAIGGRMTQLDKTFPTNECAMCVVSPKLVDCARHLNIEIITNADIEEVSGVAPNFNVRLKKRPRYVDEDKCTACGACMLNCPVRNKINIIDEKEKVVLSDQDSTTLDDIIAKFKNKDGYLMLILQAINRQFGYFSKDTLRYLSHETGISLSSILRIVTFYDAFSLVPRGRHTISVCMGTTCYVKGSEKILNRLSEILDIGVGQTSTDFKFTLKSVRCLGCCSIAPAIMIDDKVYGNLKLNGLKIILNNYK